MVVEVFSHIHPGQKRKVLSWRHLEMSFAGNFSEK